MTKPRSQLIDISQTPYYHCISRCVRRAFLCGEDHVTGKNYEYRKDWMIERLALLSRVFSIQISSYAVMSNHYHVVLRVDKYQANEWDDPAVAKRWRQIYGWPLLVNKYLKGDTDKAETMKDKEVIQTWRERLYDISWFMRCLNEHLARRANAEDQCTGSFWESRYKSQALLGDAAVLTCMSYVDLNPIRAKTSDTPENSDYTSVQQRINKLHASTKPKGDKNKSLPEQSSPTVKLMPLVKQKNDNHPNAIGYTLRDYLELIDWVGRSVRSDKRGAISSTTPPILSRLGINEDEFIEHVLTYEDKNHYPIATGPLENIITLAKHWKQKFIKGQYTVMKLYHPNC